MDSFLKRIQIVGLYGKINIDVIVENNTLVLVGENGSGKTTFLRILFHFLSGRWFSLLQFRFDSINVTINDETYGISRSEISEKFKKTDRSFFARHFPIPVRNRLTRLVENNQINELYTELHRASERYDIPIQIMMDEIKILEEHYEKNKNKTNDIKRIQDAIATQIVYLPTYRRIEQELDNIFEGIDISDYRRRKNMVRLQETKEIHVELIEFGMDDVQRAINRTLDELKEFARGNLNNLTLEYLGDVLNRTYNDVEVKKITELSEDTVLSVFKRSITGRIKNTDQNHLFEVIKSVRSSSTLKEHDKIIIHYFLKLLDFQELLQKKEQAISEFCNLCTEYMVDKKLIYDSGKFTFNIIQTESEKFIELKELSSGEKQIVSLFSHLYLSGRDSYFVLIDEPELSLSVPWQRRFLSDICKNNHCSGLIAVTHSPFIYENELETYAHSLGEFVSA